MTNNSNNFSRVILPLIIAVSVCIGIVIGNFFELPSFQKNVFSGGKNTDTTKIDSLFNLINRAYVDTVDMHELTENAIPLILEQLDPHSIYIPASDVAGANEELEGSFVGIGVQFNIKNDTVVINGVISGGPSEKLGILPGDRIVEVNDSVFVGSKITEDFVLKKLRGEKGSIVKVGIKRSSSNSILQFTIKRDDIPIHSIDVAYMIDKQTGYVKINRFSATTYKEFLNAITHLKKEGSKQLILDFRSNSGGYLSTAIAMLNEFLPKNSLIVYTEGKASPRDNTLADGTGAYQTIKLAVLIDEWSASASEIFAGAIQDNDRGIIVGRRSFGKGLVQMPVTFTDGSVVRLTISRYYTPSGRSIQKPYTNGQHAEYASELLNRYEHGEFDVKDSIKFVDSLQYHTLKGRVVYGGGGIMPDIFVPRDTSGYSPYYNKLMNNSYIYQYAFDFADKRRQYLKQFKTRQALIDYLRTQNIIEGLVQYAELKGVRQNIIGLRKSQGLIENVLEAYIVRIILGDKEFYPVLNEKDITITKALEALYAQY
jgi:carboxyl-terminal processing protease